MECVTIVQPAGVTIWMMWQLGRDTSNVPVGVEYLRDSQLEMDGDPEGQSSGYDMTSMQIVPCHIAGMGALYLWSRKLFPTVR